MDRTVRFATPVYRYGPLELSLGTALGIGTDVAQGAMRGRLKRLGTLGLLEGSPGKGARRLYSWEEALQLLTALLMADAGLDPVVIVPAIKAVWARPGIQQNLKRVTSKEALGTSSSPGNPIWLMLRLQATKPWRTGDARDVVPWISLFPRTDPKDGSDNLLMRLDRDEPTGWVAFRNLTTAAQTMQTMLHTKDPTP